MTAEVQLHQAQELLQPSFPCIFYCPGSACQGLHGWSWLLGFGRCPGPLCGDCHSWASGELRGRHREGQGREGESSPVSLCALHTGVLRVLGAERGRISRECGHWVFPAAASAHLGGLISHQRTPVLGGQCRASWTRTVPVARDS